MSPAAPSTARERGALLAEIYAGCWRRDAPPVDVTPEALASVARLLLQAGGGAAAWLRIRDTAAASAPEADELRHAYLLHSVETAVHERRIGVVLSLVRRAGVEPLLAKGWAVARYYAEEGLRPYGDVDLAVRPEEYDRTKEALANFDEPWWIVDVHRGLARLDDRNPEERYRRAGRVAVGDTEVSVLGPEDHLRFLCLHMLGHGALRPLWVTDLGAVLDAAGDDFDWDYFLDGSPRRTGWAACALRLAAETVGASLDRAPALVRDARLPGWVVPEVLGAWGSYDARPHGRRVSAAAFLRSPARLVRHPVALARALRVRWPNKVEATIARGASFGRAPRLPLQLAECVARAVAFLEHPHGPSAAAGGGGAGDHAWKRSGSQSRPSSDGDAM